MIEIFFVEADAKDNGCIGFLVPNWALIPKIGEEVDFSFNGDLIRGKVLRIIWHSPKEVVIYLDMDWKP